MRSTVIVSPDFDGEDPKKVMDALAKKIGRVIASQLNQAGLTIVRDARSKVPSKEYHELAADAREAASLTGGSINLSSADGFNDDTGNLRSSIGFVIAQKGKLITSDFTESPRGTDKATGLDTGKKYAEKLAEENKSNLVFVAVAGMEYAGYVEALGYDVLTGSTLGVAAKFEKDLSAALSNIDLNVIKNIDFEGLDFHE